MAAEQPQRAPDLRGGEPGRRRGAHQGRPGPRGRAGALRVLAGRPARRGRPAHLRRLGATARLPQCRPARALRSPDRTGVHPRPHQAVLRGTGRPVRTPAARRTARSAAGGRAAGGAAAPRLAGRQPLGRLLEHRLPRPEAAAAARPGHRGTGPARQRQEGVAGLPRAALRPGPRGRPGGAGRARERGAPTSGKRTHPVRVPKGYRVGRWEVGEPIASGAFATVYAAGLVGDERAGLPRRAALKFLPTGTRTPHRLHHLRELAQREVELLGRLRSPRLIRMYDTLVVDDPGHPELDGATVLVLEQARGSIDAVPDPGDPGSVLAQICEGLAQLHRAGWVHGDLKPANVLLMRDGSVRLADFGLAAEMEGAHAYVPVFVTPDYTPPELLWAEVDERGARVRPSADVWAFGVLAHVLLTGAFPLPGGTPEARSDAALRHARGAQKLRLSPGLPDAWREIVRDCLAPAHAGRLGTEALLARVEAAVGVARVPRPSGPRSRPALAGAVATALLTVSGLGVAADVTHRSAMTGEGTPEHRPVLVASASRSYVSPLPDGPRRLRR
ncbi:serine/threonine protein kinase [Streptomyces sp. S3(2020)]|nr:serine/threonine protein kinase [Streptomyces sp. S3(2020)]